MWLFGAIEAVFEGYKSARADTIRKREYENIASSPFLYSSGYLGQLSESAQTKYEIECLMKNLENHDAFYIRNEKGEIVTSVESYQKLMDDLKTKYSLLD